MFINSRARFAVTDAEGRASLAAIPGERNAFAQEFLSKATTLFAEHAAYLPTDLHHVDAQSDRKTLVLDFAFEVESLIGTVRSRAGEPLAGIRVGLFDQRRAFQRRPDGVALTSPESSATTATDGSFEVLGRVASSVFLRVEGDGWAPVGGPVTDHIAANGTLVVTLDPGQSIAGVVRDVDGGVLSGACIEYRTIGGTVRHHVTSDVRGEYSCDSLPCGELLVWALHPTERRRFASHRVLVEPGVPLAWSPTLRERTAFRVRVVDAAGAGIPELLCQLQTIGWHASWSTNGDGWTEPFAIYPDDTVHVLVRDASCEHSLPLALLEDERLSGEDLVIELAPEARALATIRGQLVGPDGAPPRHAVTMMLFDTRNEIAMPWIEYDPTSGSFQAPPQPPAEYALFVRTPDRGTHGFAAFRLAPNEKLDLGTLVLPRAGKVVVRSAEGVPESSARVVLQLVRHVGTKTTYLPAAEGALAGGALELTAFPGVHRLGAWTPRGGCRFVRRRGHERRNDGHRAPSLTSRVRGLSSGVALRSHARPSVPPVGVAPRCRPAAEGGVPARVAHRPRRGAQARSGERLARLAW